MSVRWIGATQPSGRWMGAVPGASSTSGAAFLGSVSTLTATGPVATQFLLSGPSSGTVGVASATFAVSPDGSVTSATATLSDGGAGGTFSPGTTLTWTNTSAPRTFTYSGASSGTKTLTVTITSGTPTTVSPSSKSFLVTALPYIVFIGDSNMGNGNLSPPGPGIAGTVLTSLGPTWSGQNRGVSGYTIASIDADLPNWTGSYNASRSHNFALVMIGTNNLASAGSVIYSSLVSYLSDLRAAEPRWTVGIITLPWNGSNPVPRDDYNALIKANALTDGFDFVVDATVDSDLETNTRGYTDGLHLTEIGWRALGCHVTAAILRYIDNRPPGSSAVFSPIGCGFIKGS